MHTNSLFLFKQTLVSLSIIEIELDLRAKYRDTQAQGKYSNDLT